MLEYIKAIFSIVFNCPVLLTFWWMGILILFPIQHNRLFLCTPRGQKLIFLRSPCCSGSVCQNNNTLNQGGEGEGRCNPSLLFLWTEKTPTTDTLAHGKAHLSHCFAVWARTDKQCDDQSPTIVLKGRVGGSGADPCLESVKDISAQYLRKWNEKGQKQKNKEHF